MKPTLTHKPNNYAYQQLLVNFAGGVPLSADQLNFLSRHEKALSQAGLDPALKYYLKPFHKKADEHHSFLMHRENFDAEAAKELKRRLALLLPATPSEKQEKKTRVPLQLTSRQFQEFKNAAVPSLIFFHGNQFLTGAPFYLGGLPHIVYFQWGNLFGIVKYVVLAEEKTLNSNVLVYFENMHERLIEECIHDANKELRHELQPIQQPAQTHHLEKQSPQENYTHSPFQTPKLSLSLNTQPNDKK